MRGGARAAAPRRAGVGLLCGLMLLGLPAFAAIETASLVVFGAASLTNALQEVGDGFTRLTSIPIKFSFAASSALARQIESGAAADVFVSADEEWMEYLQTRQLIKPATRADLLGNRLVLIAPADSRLELKIAPGFALAAALGKERLVTGDPDAVPVGRYAREALTKLGVWDRVADRLVRADSVRSALAFVDRGEAALGIVYETDALIDQGVRVVDVFPEATHAPITYPVALTSSATSNAMKFLEYLRSPAAGIVFKHYGFAVLH
jgi:molybdate transport system substrate-binding protein